MTALIIELMPPMHLDAGMNNSNSNSIAVHTKITKIIVTEGHLYLSKRACTYHTYIWYCSVGSHHLPTCICRYIHHT